MCITLKDASDIVHNAVTSVAVFVGGYWVWLRFVREREQFPRVEFSLELEILGKTGNVLLVEPCAVVTNRGQVRHWLKNFRFSLFYLPAGAVPVCRADAIHGQAKFTNSIDERLWVPAKYKNSFVDASATQRFTYVTTVPADAAFLLLYSRFKYRDSESEFHTAQKVFSVAARAHNQLSAAAKQ